MEGLSKQQLAFFKSIIKEIMESDRKLKLEKEIKLKEEKETKNKAKFLEMKKKYKPNLAEVIDEVKDILYNYNYEEQDFNISEEGIYDTSNFILGFEDEVKQLYDSIKDLVIDFSKNIITKEQPQ